MRNTSRPIRRHRSNRHTRFAHAIERIESRLLLSAATYTGIPTTGVNPNATSEASGTSFLSIYGGSTVGATHGSIKQSYGAIEFGPSSAVFPPAGHQINSISSIALTLFNSATSGNFQGTN